MNDEQFRLACEKELKYIAKQERKLQKQAMNSDSGWKNALESLIPEKIYINLRAAFATAFNLIFEKGLDVIEKTYSKDRLMKDFESKDTAVDSIQSRRELRKFRSNVSSSKRWKSIITTAEGVGLGALGIGLPDVVLFIGFILQSIYEVALKYGYDYNKPEERLLILKMMSAAIAKQEKWLKADLEVEELIRNPKQPDYDEVEKPTMFDGLKNNWESTLSQLCYMSSHIQEYQDNLNAMLSDVDKEVCDLLRANHIRYEVDYEDKNMNAKIKEFKNYKIPYIVVVGGNEAEERTVSINIRGTNQQLRGVPLDMFLDMCDQMNEEHSLELLDKKPE